MKPARWASFDAGRRRRLNVGALIALLLLVPSALAADTVQRLREAQFALSEADVAPVNPQAWQPQSLPDNWALSRPGTFGNAWYRLRFVINGPAGGHYAILLPLVSKLQAVRLNGTEIGSGAIKAPPGSPDILQPRLLEIPPGLMLADGNELLLRVGVEDHDEGGVSTISVGEIAALRSEFNRLTFQLVTGAQFATLLTGLIGIFVLMLWLRRPQESTYGLFGFAVVLRATLGVSYFIDQPLLPAPYWGLLHMILFDLFQLLINLFVLRFAGWHWPRYERILWAYAALFAFGALSTKVWGWQLPAAVTWVTNDYIPVISYTGIAVLAAWRRHTLSTVLLAATALFVFFSYLYETLLPQALDLGPLWPYRFLPLYLVIGWALIDRFAHSLSDLEHLNSELEQRVRDKHNELEQNYQRLRTMERQQAVVEERQRIMSDMHDGVGGQLISTLGLVEHGDASSADVAAALRECLDNLRLIIDSLEPIENDLLPVLGNLRYRIDGRLKEQGITLDWRVCDLPKLSCLTPQNVLHVLRILQEAFTNVLKHARASMIRVETGSEPDGKRVFIRVSDNGRGFRGDGAGRGLGNMRQRACIIGGELDIQSSSSGTTLSLSLPIA